MSPIRAGPARAPLRFRGAYKVFGIDLNSKYVMKSYRKPRMTPAFTIIFN
jgi:hypothetical protein